MAFSIVSSTHHGVVSGCKSPARPQQGSIKSSVSATARHMLNSRAPAVLHVGNRPSRECQIHSAWRCGLEGGRHSVSNVSQDMRFEQPTILRRGSLTRTGSTLQRLLLPSLRAVRTAGCCPWRFQAGKRAAPRVNNCRGIATNLTSSFSPRAPAVRKAGKQETFTHLLAGRQELRRARREDGCPACTASKQAIL